MNSYLSQRALARSDTQTFQPRTGFELESPIPFRRFFLFFFFFCFFFLFFVVVLFFFLLFASIFFFFFWREWLVMWFYRSLTDSETALCLRQHYRFLPLFLEQRKNRSKKVYEMSYAALTNMPIL